MTLKIDETGIAGVLLEHQPRIGTNEGAVLHLLPGGVGNPEGFSEKLLDIYASTAKGKGTQRGGHYHEKLDELFFTVTGTALWILSDFRPDSPTYQKTVGIILGEEKPEASLQFLTSVTEDGSLARLRVPHGVYHTYIPLTEKRVMVIALGSTPYVKEDYQYPVFGEIPGALDILSQAGITPTGGSAA